MISYKPKCNNKILKISKNSSINIMNTLNIPNTIKDACDHDTLFYDTIKTYPPHIRTSLYNHLSANFWKDLSSSASIFYIVVSKMWLTYLDGENCKINNAFRCFFIVFFFFSFLSASLRAIFSDHNRKICLYMSKNALRVLCLKIIISNRNIEKQWCTFWNNVFLKFYNDCLYNQWPSTSK